jgi:hypothetical protein
MFGTLDRTAGGSVKLSCCLLAVGGFIRVANASVILCCVCSGKILNWDTECTATVCTNVGTCHGHCVWFSSVFTVHLFFLTFKSSTN